MLGIEFLLFCSAVSRTIGEEPRTCDQPPGIVPARILVARNGSCPPSGKVPKGWRRLAIEGSSAPNLLRIVSMDLATKLRDGRHPRTAT